MCEANVYLDQNGLEEMILEAVDVIEPQENHTFRMVTIFGEQKTIRGRLKMMNLVDHKIIFIPEEE
jgi:predicted RNA-binding protein